LAVGLNHQLAIRTVSCNGAGGPNGRVHVKGPVVSGLNHLGWHLCARANLLLGGMILLGLVFWSQSKMPSCVGNSVRSRPFG
jgi:hypothetical protein